jgi:hypothetical protein
VHGNHLRALVGGRARLIIAVRGAIDWRLRVRKPTDQSRPTLLIVNGIFFVFWKDNCFGGALGMADRLGGASGMAQFISFGFLYGLDLRS